MKNNKTASLSLRKLVLSVLVTAPLATLPVPLWGLPSSAANLQSQVSSVSSGVTVGWTSATRVDVTSSATNSVIKWVNFGDGSNMTINAGDTINYALPSSSSSVLNMVTGTSSTLINGTLSSNGNLYVQNPNGIVVGSTGVITANGVGLSTVPETEYNFLATGSLTGVENQNIATSNQVKVTNGAVITAASGTGNVWIAAKGADLSGTIDGGAVSVTSVRGGDVMLGVNGDLVVGDASAHSSTLTVNTQTYNTVVSGNTVVNPGGNITVGNATVYGASASLTAGNANIVDNGNVMLGAGSGTNATLTTSSGTGNTTLNNVFINGTGTLTVNATTTAAPITINSASGNLAVGATGGALTTQAAGNLTLNAGNVTSVTATSTGGDILSGGTLATTGNVSLTVTNAHNIALHTKAAPAATLMTVSGNGTLGNITLTQDTGVLSVPQLIAASVTATGGNVTLGGSQTITGLASYTATGNGTVTLGQTVSAGNLTVVAGTDVSQTNTVDSAGKVSYTATAGNISIGGVIGNTTFPASVSLTAGNNISIGAAVKASKVTATAGNDLTTSATIDGTAGNSTVALTATAGNATIGGAIGSGTAGNSVSISGGKLATVNSSVTTSGGSITINAGSDLAANGALSTGNASVGSATLTASGNATLNANVTAGSLTVTAGGLATVTGNSAINATNSVGITSGSDLTEGGAITAGNGTVTLTSSSGKVVLNNTIGAGNLTVSAGKDLNYNAITTATGTVSLTAVGNVNLSADLIAPTLKINAPLTTQTAGNVITSTGTATLTTTGNLTGAFGNVVLLNPGTLNLTSSTNVTVANGTNAAGNVSITTTGNGSVALGTAAADVLTFGKDLTINTSSGNGPVTEGANNVTVSGNLTVTAGNGTVTLAGNSGNGVGLNTSYGRVNITTSNADAKIFETQVLNLGNITLGTGNITAYSATGIVNSGVLTVANVNVGAGTASAPGNITLDAGGASSGNKISGTITIQTDLGLLGSSSVGNYLANNLTVVNGASNANLLTLVPNVYGNTPAINVALTAVGNANLGVGQLSTTGTVALTSNTGDITATNAANTFSNVTVQSAGNVTVSSTKDLTVNTTATGLSGTGNSSFSSGGALTIGSFTNNSTGSTAFTATKALTDSVPGIHIYGPVSFSGSSVSITNSGHSFGGVTLTTTGNGTATIVESGTLNLAGVNTGTGAFTATSSNGSIIQPSSGSTGIKTGAATFTANNGDVLLTDSTNNAFGNVSVTAMGNATIDNTANTALAGVTASNGNLAVNVTSGKNITQVSGAKIYSYGATSFVTGGAGTITLTNAGNQFGGLTLTTGTGNVGITEQTTMNLKSVTTSGTFTATSAGGDIIDSGVLNATGTSILSTPSGNVMLTKSDNFGTVSFNTAGNASVTNAGTLTLGNSTVGGSLAVTATTINQTGSVAVTGNETLTANAGSLTLNTTSVGGALTASATTSASQTGALSVFGTTSFTTGTTLTLNNTSNTFGAFRLNTGSDALIDEATSFNLLAGSVSTGAVTINTGGNFVTSGTGGSSFTGSGLTVNATGTIIPSAGSLLVTGTFTVNSPSTKDLSQLSKAGNLANHDPVNLGTGPYTAPSP